MDSLYIYYVQDRIIAPPCALGSNSNRSVVPREIPQSEPTDPSTDPGPCPPSRLRYPSSPRAGSTGEVRWSDPCRCTGEKRLRFTGDTVRDTGEGCACGNLSVTRENGPRVVHVAVYSRFERLSIDR